MPIIQENTIQVGDGIFADVEVHPKTDEPVYYPQHTATFGANILFLCNPHDASYKPTPKEQDELKKKIQEKEGWAYLRVRSGRERES